MIVGLLWLLGCQLTGEVVVRLLGVAIPGPVVGLVLLLVVLRVRRPRTGDPLVATGDRLLEHLQLLFVPAGVGVVAYASTLRDQALPLGLAVVLSWLAALATVGWTLTLLSGRLARRSASPGGDPR